jgi:AcrR family transcriptional regulator
MMESPGEVKRKYRSALRDTQARATRRAIVEAAMGLFVERGYAGTSIDLVAETAGVSRATVFNAVGGKSTLLRAAYDTALVGDDEPVPLPQRPWAQPVRLATTQRDLLERYAEMLLLVNGRTARIYEVLRAAADTDEDARRHWEQVGSERRQGCATILSMLEDRGPLRGNLDAEEAADVLWVLNDPGLYRMLVLERGWLPDRFGGWLAAAMIAQLLPDRNPRTTK